MISDSFSLFSWKYFQFLSIFFLSLWFCKTLLKGLYSLLRIGFVQHEHHRWDQNKPKIQYCVFKGQLLFFKTDDWWHWIYNTEKCHSWPHSWWPILCLCVINISIPLLCQTSESMVCDKQARQCFIHPIPPIVACETQFLKCYIMKEDRHLRFIFLLNLSFYCDLLF